MRNRLFIIILATMGTLFISWKQGPDCRSFKIGKFELEDTLNKRRFIIERNDSIQFEYSYQTGDTTKFRVKWTTDCEYYLTIISGKPQIMDFYKGKKLIINILKTYTDSYKFSSHLENDSRTRYQILKKIE